MLLPSFTTLLNRAILSCILLTIDTVFFLGGYSVLRVLRISVNWVVWIFGYLIIIASAALCYSVSTPTYSFGDRGFSNLLGVFSFLIALYAASQWISRRWYVFIKKRTISFFVQQSRNFFSVCAQTSHVLWLDCRRCRCCAYGRVPPNAF